jgi:hypothetical protein
MFLRHRFCNRAECPESPLLSNAFLGECFSAIASVIEQNVQKVLCFYGSIQYPKYHGRTLFGHITAQALRIQNSQKSKVVNQIRLSSDYH